MKKIISMAAVLAVLFAAGCAKKSAVAPAAVSVPKVMLSVLVEFKALKAASEAKDYAACRKSFSALAGLFASLESVQPETGTKLTWDTIHRAIIASCKTGIAGCDAGNGTVVEKSIAAITTAMMSGHKIFRITG
jgi:hypothetical protein